MYKLALSPLRDNVEEHLNFRGPRQFWDRVFWNKLILHAFCVRIMTRRRCRTSCVINRMFRRCRFGSCNVCRDADISREPDFEIRRNSTWQFGHLYATFTRRVHVPNAPPTRDRRSAPTPTKNGNLSSCPAIYARVVASRDLMFLCVYSISRADGARLISKKI